MDSECIREGGCPFPVSTAHFLILVTVKVEGTLVIGMTCQYFVQLAWSINYFYPRFTIPYTSFSMLLINNMLWTFFFHAYHVLITILPFWVIKNAKIICIVINCLFTSIQPLGLPCFPSSPMLHIKIFMHIYIDYECIHQSHRIKSTQSIPGDYNLRMHKKSFKA